MKQRIRALPISLAAIVAVGFHSPANSDWRNLVDQIISSEQLRSHTENRLNNSEIAAGLKETLAQGVETSINTLGRKNGFLNNERVRILLPDSLRSMEKIARKAGQGKRIDRFITTMNRAAEQATPQSAKILGDSIRKMNISDAQKILYGPDNAATDYFQRSSGQQLTHLLLPLVRQTTNRTGVTAAYKSLTAEFNKLGGGILGSFIDTKSLDLDRYVTEKTIEGLFQYIAIEEKRIRTNPAARTTDLLKRLFKNY